MQLNAKLLRENVDIIHVRSEQVPQIFKEITRLADIKQNVISDEVIRKAETLEIDLTQPLVNIYINFINLIIF